jgi:hypothetical protein
MHMKKFSTFYCTHIVITVNDIQHYTFTTWWQLTSTLLIYCNSNFKVSDPIISRSSIGYCHPMLLINRLWFPTDLTSLVWFSSEGDRLVIAPLAHRCKTSNRILYAIFFDSKGPVLQIPVPKSSSVTKKFYRESVLTQLVDFYQTQTAHQCLRHQITSW